MRLAKLAVVALLMPLLLTGVACQKEPCTIMVNEWDFFEEQTDSQCLNTTFCVPSPASCYCREQGYDWRIEETPLGEVGICIFPDGTECGEWAFFEGECGQEWSFCEQQGGEIITVDYSPQYPCPFTTQCAYCILSCEEYWALYPDELNKQ